LCNRVLDICVLHTFFANLLVLTSASCSSLSLLTLTDYRSHERLGDDETGTDLYLRHQFVQTDSGAHTTAYTTGFVGSFPAGKTPTRKADHSPPSRAEV
jgi:hypothetical protein